MQLFIASTAYNGKVVTQNLFITDSKDKLLQIIKENQEYEDKKFEWYWEVESIVLDKFWNYNKTTLNEDIEMQKELKHGVKGYISKAGVVLKEEPDYL